MSIRSRISIPGGTCEFDLPAYYAWQQHDARSAAAPTCCSWVGTLMPLAEALQCCCGLLRDTGAPHTVVARAGSSSRACRPGAAYQLLRVRLGRRVDAGARDQRPPADGRRCA